MGRVLDHAERDRAVIDATWQLLARDGLGGLSVRKVAAEAGLPPSSLRYTFPTIAALRERAARLVVERMLSRVEAVEGAGLERALALVLELVPLDEVRRVEMEAFLALGSAAGLDPLLEQCYREAHIAIRGVCADALRALDPRRGPGEEDVQLASLHALVDGVSLHLVRQPPSGQTAWARTILEGYLRGCEPR
ncbi:TetR family transcriptional regulator C-terminal domain-containing protein [Streptosporangium sp. NPDC006013]|uniref:TetR/AcrR family transcriptional regulator n=1 Tax=Streptosporangium sp. NPDC006013 TaxID=3155596 RepID=UPI00339EFF64